MPDMPTGALVRLHRIERRMSTTSLATHAGITVRWRWLIRGNSPPLTSWVSRSARPNRPGTPPPTNTAMPYGCYLI